MGEKESPLYVERIHPVSNILERHYHQLRTFMPDIGIENKASDMSDSSKVLKLSLYSANHVSKTVCQAFSRDILHFRSLSTVKSAIIAIPELMDTWIRNISSVGRQELMNELYNQASVHITSQHNSIEILAPSSILNESIQIVKSSILYAVVIHYESTQQLREILVDSGHLFDQESEMLGWVCRWFRQLCYNECVCIVDSQFVENHSQDPRIIVVDACCCEDPSCANRINASVDNHTSSVFICLIDTCICRLHYNMTTILSLCSKLSINQMPNRPSIDNGSKDSLSVVESYLTDYQRYQCSHFDINLSMSDLTCFLSEMVTKQWSMKLVDEGISGRELIELRESLSCGYEHMHTLEEDSFVKHGRYSQFNRQLVSNQEIKCSCGKNCKLYYENKDIEGGNEHVPTTMVDDDWFDIGCPNSREDNETSICSLNVLSQGVIRSHLYSHLNPNHLLFESRGKMLYSWIYHHHPDILCLQECDLFELNWFHFLLVTMGYEAVHFERQKKSVKRMDGLCVAYDPSKFKLVNHWKLNYDEIAFLGRHLLDSVSEHEKTQVMHSTHSRRAFRNRARQHTHSSKSRKGRGAIKANLKANMGSVVLLESIETGLPQLIVNTHLHWDPKRADLKLKQVQYLLQAVDSILQHIKSQDCEDMTPENENRRSIPVLMCMDCNSLPHSQCYQYIHDWNGSSFERLRSVYSLSRVSESPSEPVFTTHSVGFIGCVDYIWYSSNSLVPSFVNSLPEWNVVQTGIPNSQWGSDHVPLLARMKYT